MPVKLPVTVKVEVVVGARIRLPSLIRFTTVLAPDVLYFAVDGLMVRLPNPPGAGELLISLLPITVPFASIRIFTKSVAITPTE